MEEGYLERKNTWVNYNCHFKQGIYLSGVVYSPRYLGGWGRRQLKEMWFKNKRAEGMAQVVEHLPSKCEAPSSNHSITKPNQINNTS
jgi:hypothetical protein